MATQLIRDAFSKKPELLQSIDSLSHTNPALQDVFEDVAKYVLELQARGASAASATPDATDERASKRRKLNGAAPPDFLTAEWKAPAIDLSFLAPVRKKLALQISPDSAHGVRALNPASKKGEFGIPWSQLETVLRLPVPEKTSSSHNYCVFAKGGDGLSSIDGTAATEGAFETIVYGASNTHKKGEEGQPTESEIVKMIFDMAKVDVVEPDTATFSRVVKNSLGREHTQYHVKAHRGSKEGYLFFLRTGIAFVFKKPLLYLALSAIKSISFTSVLSRTFNLVVSAVPAGSETGDPVEIEFAMLDQEDFEGVKQYTKTYEIPDSSLDEKRKAKVYNVNKDKNTAEAEEGEEDVQNGHGGENGEQTTMAGQDLDDDDEEGDENFDPGSEGESEGEGSSSDEDEDNGQAEAGGADDEVMDDDE